MKGLIAANMKPTSDPRRRNRGFAEPMTREQVDSLLAEDWLRGLVADIRNGHEEKKELLPFICPHYAEFKNNHRAQADIIPEAFTYMTCVDVDELALVDKAIEGALALNADEYSEWNDQVLRIAYSARKKVHIYLRLLKGKTIEETQRLFCQELGVPYDESCTTPERFIYVTGKDEEVFRSPHWLEPLSEEELAERREAYLERGLDIDGRRTHPQPLSVSEGSSQGTNLETAEVSTPLPREGNGGGVATERTRFIFDECMRECELEPEVLIVEGGRHEAVKSLLSVGASQLLTKEEFLGVLSERMPDNWQDENIRKLVDDFYAKYHDPSQKMTQFQRRVFAKSLKRPLSNSPRGEEDEDLSPALSQGEGESPKGRFSAKKLPIGLKESLIGVPETMHMPVLCAVLPIAGAYADGVEVEYCDGQRHKLGLMSIIRGEQASNKSICKTAVDVWKRQFDQEDALARKREDEWKEQRKRRKANEKAPEDPHVLIRMVPVTVSCSTLLKRLKNAQGHTLYSFGEELDTLRKTNGAGSWSSKYDIYRMGFDHGEWGQDYNSDQAESGVVQVAYNWTMLGTYGAVRRCFKSDNIENGLSSRVLMAEMPDGAFAKLTKFSRRSEADEARIQEAVTKLRSYSGFIDTPRLRKAIEKWVESKRQEAAKNIDYVMDTYRKRAAVIGFRCGVIHHLLLTHPQPSSVAGSPTLTPNLRCPVKEVSSQGKKDLSPALSQGEGEVSPRGDLEGVSPRPLRERKGEGPVGPESPASLRFALAIAEYCLEQQMKAFGETLMDNYISASQEGVRNTCNHNVFDELPPTFTIGDLRALKQNICGESALRNIILRWRRDGWIEKIDSKHWRKCHIVTLSQ